MRKHGESLKSSPCKRNGRLAHLDLPALEISIPPLYQSTVISSRNVRALCQIHYFMSQAVRDHVATSATSLRHKGHYQDSNSKDTARSVDFTRLSDRHLASNATAIRDLWIVESGQALQLPLSDLSLSDDLPGDNSDRISRMSMRCRRGFYLNPSGRLGQIL